MADKLSAREVRAKIEREVIAHEELPRRYGYTLNVSNKTLTVIYNDFKQRYYYAANFGRYINIGLWHP